MNTEKLERFVELRRLAIGLRSFFGGSVEAVKDLRATDGGHVNVWCDVVAYASKMDCAADASMTLEEGSELLARLRKSEPLCYHVLRREAVDGLVRAAQQAITVLEASEKVQTAVLLASAIADLQIAMDTCYQ